MPYSDPERKRAYNRAYYAKNRERINRLGNLKARYGITVEEYEALLERQNGVCGICGAEPGSRRLATDHAHTTGRVRGLLCDACNQALGFMKDDPERLIAAAIYLRTTNVEEEAAA